MNDIALECERCGEPITPEQPRIYTNRRDRADDTVCSHMFVVCSWSCLMLMARRQAFESRMKS